MLANDTHFYDMHIDLCIIACPKADVFWHAYELRRANPPVPANYSIYDFCLQILFCLKGSKASAASASTINEKKTLTVEQAKLKYRS